MRIKLSFPDALIDDCWFGFETHSLQTVTDLCLAIENRFKIGNSSLEMDGFILLGNDRVSNLLRDDDLILVKRLKELNSPLKIPQDRSLQVHIHDRFSDSSHDTLSNNDNYSTHIIDSAVVDSTVEILDSQKSEIADEEVDDVVDEEVDKVEAEMDVTADRLEECADIDFREKGHEKEKVEDASPIETRLEISRDLEDGQVLTTDEVVDEDKQLFVPIPEFSEDELDESFTTSNNNMTTFSYSKESKYRVDGLREKGTIIHFEQVQRKGGWMDYGGNTMEWTPPESKQGWNISPAKPQIPNEDVDHWNTQSMGSKPLKKKPRYDNETFNRGNSSRNNSSCTCFIWNLRENVSKVELKQLFSDCGKIIDIKLVQDKNYDQTGYIEFSNSFGANRAFGLDQKLYLNGSKIRIKLSESNLSSNFIQESTLKTLNNSQESHIVKNPIIEKSQHPIIDQTTTSTEKVINPKTTQSINKPEPTNPEILTPCYCVASGLCKPIKISIFTSFLLKSGAISCFSNEQDSVILSFNSIVKMNALIHDFSGKSLIGSNLKTVCTFKVLEVEDFEGLKPYYTKKFF